jgi:hypothetical protein
MEYKSEVKEKNGEFYVELPVELINQMGWTEETILEWECSNNSAFLKESIFKGKRKWHLN